MRRRRTEADSPGVDVLVACWSAKAMLRTPNRKMSESCAVDLPELNQPKFDFQTCKTLAHTIQLSTNWTGNPCTEYCSDYLPQSSGFFT